MTNTNSKMGKKWILAAVVLAGMLGAGSLAVALEPAVPNDPTEKAPMLIGQADTTGGIRVGTLNKFQWSEDALVTLDEDWNDADNLLLAKTTKHTIVVRVHATQGDTGLIEVESLQCIAGQDDQKAFVSAKVNRGLIIDIQEGGTSDLNNIRITDKPNEWIVNVPNCDIDPTVIAGENVFVAKVNVLDSGVHSFSIHVEAIE